MTMKLFAFRIHKPWTNVQVWEWREVEMSFFAVLRSEIVSALPVPDPGRPALQTLSELADSVRPIAFRNPDGDTVRLPRALIVATSFVDLLDFLLASYVPQGDGAIDGCLRTGASTAEVREEVGRLLWNGRGFRRWVNAGPARRFVLLQLSELPILWYAEGYGRLLSHTARVERPDGEHLFCTSGSRV